MATSHRAKKEKMKKVRRERNDESVRVVFDAPGRS